jgi:hypothetical protein
MSADQLPSGQPAAPDPRRTASHQPPPDQPPPDQPPPDQPPPDLHPDRYRQRSYYRQRDVTITSRYFEAGGHRYEIAELTELMRARGSMHPGALVGLVIAVVEAILITPVVGLLPGPRIWLLATAALLVPCLVGLVCVRRWPAQFDLLASYRGRLVTLFSSRDAREFGQVARAVQRAVEASGRYRLP